jgi:signal transduction histidine kinase
MAATYPFQLKRNSLVAGRLFYVVLFVLCSSVFILANYGQAVQWAFGDCDAIYFAPEYRPNCVLWRDAIMSTGLSPEAFAGYFFVLRVTAALPFVFLSVVLIRRRSVDLRVLLLAGFLLLVGTAGPTYNPFWQWSTSWFTVENQVPILPIMNRLLVFLLSIGTVLFVFLFPDGKFVPRWARWIALLWLVMQIGDVFFPETPLSLYTLSYPLAIIVNTAFTLCVVGALIFRYRVHANAVQRQQIKWVTAGALLLSLNYALDYAVWEIYPALTGEYLIVTHEQGVIWELVQDTLWYVSQFLFAICVGLAVFRHRLWDIDLILSRTLVYGALTGLIIGLYVLIVGLLSALFHTQATPLSGLIATVIIAVLFQPLRDRLHRGVNRLLYGERDDPAGVLTRLAQQVETTDTSNGLLPSLVQTIAHTLKVPGVAIRFPKAESRGAQLVAWGSSPGPATVLPLVYQAEEIGQLEVAPRGPNERFTRAEQRLLAAIAALTATTVRAAQLSSDLQLSRQRIVSAREEERRRLRRDLHDGLGPALASMPLKLDAVIDLIPADQTRAASVLDQIKHQAQGMVADVRRVVHDLRPPALDELGLPGALRSALAQLQPHPNGLQFNFSAPDLLLDLPAAVEAAAYRITLEAVTNVVRHARAECCWITLAADKRPAQLRITIEDDGIGMPLGVTPNVGLNSMRERAEELGGTFAIQPRDRGGTRVMVSLPLGDGGHA